MNKQTTKTQETVSIDHAMWLWDDKEVVVVDYRNGDKGFDHLPNSNGACFITWRDLTKTEKINYINRAKSDMVQDGLDIYVVMGAFNNIKGK